VVAISSYHFPENGVRYRRLRPREGKIWRSTLCRHLTAGYGEADYLLFLDGAPIGVVEAKKEGDTLTGVELQTTKYSEGVPYNLTTPRRPLPHREAAGAGPRKIAVLRCR